MKARELTWAEHFAVGAAAVVLAAVNPLALWFGHLTLGYGAPPGWASVAVWLISCDIELLFLHARVTRDG